MANTVKFLILQSVVGLLLLPGMLLANPVVDHNLIVQFYKQERWKQVAETAEEFLRKYPQDQRAPTVRLYWGQALVHLREFDEARTQFRTFLETAEDHPDRPLARYRIAEASYFLKDFDQARKELEAFLDAHEGHRLAEWAWVYLGEVQFRLDDAEDAVRTFRQYVEKHPQGALIDDAEYGLARAYEVQGKTGEALELFQRIAGRPGSTLAPQARFNVAARHFDDGHYEQAAEAFLMVAQQFPQHSLVPLAELNCGYARYHLREFSEAIGHFEAAAQDPRHRETARYWIGLSHKSQGEYEQASEVFSKALQEKPDQPLAENLTFHWADAQFRQRNYDRAVELFLRTVNRWPQGELADDALHSATEAAFQTGDLEQAEELHQQFFDTFESSGLLAVQELLYGRILISRGDSATEASVGQEFYQQAAELLARVRERTGVPRTKRSATYQLARAQERLNKDQAVTETLDDLLRERDGLGEREQADALLLRANAHLRLKQFEQAVADYREILALVTDEEETLLALSGLAGALTARGQWDELAETLDSIEAIDPEDRQHSRVSVAAGDAAFDRNEWERAEALFRPVVGREQGRHYAVALSGLAHTVYEQKRFAEAAELFHRLHESADADVKLRSHATYMQALALRQAGELEQALTLFQETYDRFRLTAEEPDGEALEAGLNAYRAAKGAARAARELDRSEDAERLYETAFTELKRHPEQARQELDLLLNEWAELSYNAKRYERADELYALLVQECPESPLADDARLILAESLRFGGKPDEAKLAFQDLANQPAASDFVRQRAFVHLLDLAAEAADWPEVLILAESLETEFSDSDHQTYVAYRRGEGLLQTDEFESAATVFESLNSQLAEDFDSAPEWWPESWLLLAETYYRLKEYSKLDAVLDDLRNKAADSPVLYRADALTGRSLENQARFEEARQAYQRVIESEHGQQTETAAEAQFRIAESHLKEKNFDVALKEYYKVYAGYDAPRYESAALFQAGRCDASLKNWRGAVQSYRTLLEEFPESEFAEDARKQLAEIEAAFPELKTSQE